MKFNHHRYTYTNRFGSSQHHWQVVGPVGGVSFHASVSDAGKYETSCGLEFHHSARAGMFKDQAPHHRNCDVIGEPCWHDGTSLYAKESLWPMIESYLSTGDHSAVFRILEGEYARHFEQSRE